MKRALTALGTLIKDALNDDDVVVEPAKHVKPVKAVKDVKPVEPVKPINTMDDLYDMDVVVYPARTAEETVESSGDVEDTRFKYPVYMVNHTGPCEEGAICDGCKEEIMRQERFKAEEERFQKSIYVKIVYCADGPPDDPDALPLFGDNGRVLPHFFSAFQLSGYVLMGALGVPPNMIRERGPELTNRLLEQGLANEKGHYTNLEKWRAAAKKYGLTETLEREIKCASYRE